MSKAATSALGVGSLERLNSAAQSGYASGSLVVAANRSGASTAGSGGFGGDLDHRISTRSHQQVVNLTFVLVRNIGNGFGQGEDEVEIPHRQQFSLTCRKPCLRRSRLTFWAVTVAA